MRLADDIEQAILPLLPAQLRPQAGQLARALADAAGHPPDEPQEPLRLNDQLRPLLEALAGREVQAGGTAVTFGADGQFGDVAFRDVAGRDIVSYTLNFYLDRPAHPTPRSAAPWRWWIVGALGLSAASALVAWLLATGGMSTCGPRLSDRYSYVQRGIAARDEGTYDCARKDLEAALSYATLPAERAEVFYALATVAIAEDAPDRAHNLASEGLKGSPDDGLLLVADALALCRLERNDEAAQRLAAALALTSTPQLPLSQLRALHTDLAAGRSSRDTCIQIALDLP